MPQTPTVGRKRSPSSRSLRLSHSTAGDCPDALGGPNLIARAFHEGLRWFWGKKGCRLLLGAGAVTRHLLPTSAGHFKRRLPSVFLPLTSAALCFPNLKTGHLGTESPAPVLR